MFEFRASLLKAGEGEDSEKSQHSQGIRLWFACGFLPKTLTFWKRLAAMITITHFQRRLIRFIQTDFRSSISVITFSASLIKALIEISLQISSQELRILKV
jgi:antibiotic biosynthesis monooxygenase (ABM) superfamily enzyme